LNVDTIVLSGPPGAGKSSVGARLAAALGATFHDTDAMVEARAGKSVPSMLREDGELAFRAREAEIVRELLRLEGPDASTRSRPRVIAFGGGTVLDRELRFLALDRARLVPLTAREPVLAQRIAGGAARPLAGPAGAGLSRLLEQRRALYAECHVSIATDDLSLDEIVDVVLPWRERALVAVPLGERSYCVEIVGHDPTRVVDHLAELGPSSIVTVTDARVRRAQGKLLDAMLAPLTVPRTDVVLAAGEAQKTLASVAALWDAALGARVDRDAVIFAFGGGVTLDLAGFAAATLLRGVRWVAAPTTVLAMLDASVGGKTGFDHASGKNLIGAFHQPSAVIADLSALTTLPDRDRKAGLAEAVKIALTSDAVLFERIESTAERLRAGDGDALLPVLSAAIAAKARVVRNDEHERGERVLLNFGHTVGHALEVHGTYSRWLHGEAVGLGLVCELRAGHALGFTPAGAADRTARVLERLGLPSEVERAELSGAMPWMASDKKRRDGALRLPLVTDIGQARCESVPLERFASALAVR
jgi:shikimate kinase/3-dehydroquinate synthase